MSYQFGNQMIFFKSAEKMDELSNNSIDAIITSPPYNIGKNYSSNGKMYNDNLDYPDYLAFLTNVFRECYRVGTDRCLFFLNIGDSAKTQGKSEDVVRCAVNAGFKRLQTIIWIKSIFGKGHYTPSGRNRRLNNLWENIFILYKTKKYQINPKNIGIPYSDKSNIGRYGEFDLRDAGDVWFIPYTKTTGATIKKGHEAPFPIELPYQCLKLINNPKNVLDPFVGTGSTLRAAEELKIPGYGYELYPQDKIIQTRFLESLQTSPTPLLPQLETYCQFITEILEKMQKKIPKEEMKEILSSFNIIPRRQFAWAANDLQIDSQILKMIQKDAKIFPQVEDNPHS